MIVEFVFKMLHPKEEEGDDVDDKEAEHGDRDDGENYERSKEDKHSEIKKSELQIWNL